MRYLKPISLFLFGIQLCEEKILPFLIRYTEPKRDQTIQPPLFRLRPQNQAEKPPRYPEVDSAVTVYEVQETIEKYQLINFFNIYAGIITLPLIAYLVSLLFKIISLIWIAPDWIVLITTIIFESAYIMIWLGAYIRIKERQEEWEHAMEREKMLEKIEYFAVTTSSKVVAGILVEIEKLKKSQKLESERTREYSKKRSLMEKEIMEKFDEMMTERERRNKRQANIKATLSWLLGFFIGYIGEQTLNTFVFGTKITFSDPSK